MPGEFILTNLGFCYEDPDLSDASLIAMIERRVAAIAVKRVYSPCFTDAVAQASVRMGVPVYLYSGAYHERVAFESLNLLQRDLDASDKSDASRHAPIGKAKSPSKTRDQQVGGPYRIDDALPLPSLPKKMIAAHCTQFKTPSTIFWTRFDSDTRMSKTHARFATTMRCSFSSRMPPINSTRASSVT